MFRIAMEIKEVNYDKMLDTFMEQIKSQQQNGMLGGMKIPPMMNMDFLKSMPQETKNAMVASAMNAEQKRMLDMLEMLAVKSGYSVQFQKLNVACVNEADCTIRFNVDIASMVYAPAIDKLVDTLIEESDLPSVMGDAYKEGISLSEVSEYMKQQDEKQQEYFVLKSMSDKKDILMRKIEHMASEKDMYLQLSNMRFLLGA